MTNIKCRKSECQNYQCQVMMRPPWKSSKEFIGFDACLAKELFWLWDKGIITTGCCCGKHSVRSGPSYIGVKNKYIEKMKKLGYKVQINNIDKTREDSFIPKTNFNN